MLRIEWTTDEPHAGAPRATLIPLPSSFSADAIDARFGRAVRRGLEVAAFKGKWGETFTVHRELGNDLQPVFFVGIGAGLTRPDEILRLTHDAVRLAEAAGMEHLVVDLRQTGLALGVEGPALGALVAQGLELGTYAYELYLSETKPKVMKSVTVCAADPAGAEGLARGQVIAEAIAKARDYGNGPAELVTPTFLAREAQTMVDELRPDHDVSLVVLDRDQCAERKMGCFLGVAKGSGEPPKFIHLSYEPAGRAKGRVALVGKGVTFDSGGYSLKPSDGMMDMKMDMCGAAAVLASFRALVRLGVPWRLDVIVAATENMIGPHAYRLGDVLTASNGKTVEINNTDAEGRLTLADALVYASQLEPDVMVDFATLTGACMVALGPRIAGVMTDDERLAVDWLAASDRCGDPMWRLPLPKDLKEQLKSKVADMRNTGERWGGALTAGLFLSEFTSGRRWLHVDIAGPSMSSKPHGIHTVGATGFPVATIVELLATDGALNV